MEQKKSVSRRTFLKTTAVTSAVFTAPAFIPQSAFGANDRVRAAVLGLNGRGKSHISGLMEQANVEVVTLCDPDSNVLRSRANDFQSKYSKTVKTEKDLRRVFEDKDVDVVTVATPNHWHSLATIWACQAGKDVYVEKPGSHTVWEGRKMVEAAHKYNRIVQHGVQLRSSVAIQEAVDHLRKGTIGKVYMARGLVFRWRGDIGRKGIEEVPSHLDYDLWLGPAQQRPFSRDIVHYNWHWNWEFGNGDVGNQGIHETDMCMWGLGVTTLPEKITAMGGKFLFDDAKETPETLCSAYHYPNEGKLIEFEVRPWCTNLEDGAGVGNIFYGSDGYLVIKGYDKYEIFLGRDRKPGPSREKGGDHFENFISCVRSRDASKLNAPVETAHLSSALAHLGNIAYRLGRVINFDPATETVKGDDEANKMLKRDYRAPFVVPEQV